jgi:hypothetical protein
MCVRVVKKHNPQQTVANQFALAFGYQLQRRPTPKKVRAIGRRCVGELPAKTSGNYRFYNVKESYIIIQGSFASTATFK